MSLLISQPLFAIEEKSLLEPLIERLTNNDYEEINPKIIIEKNGKIWVFWLSLASRTTQILYKYFGGEKWFTPEKTYECIGNWNVIADPMEGFWLTRSSWGTVYVDYFKEQNQTKEWLISSGRLGDPSITVFDKSAYLAWNKIISEEESGIEASIYTDGSWLEPSLIFTTLGKVRKPFILGREKEKLLLIAQVKKDDDWDIYVGKLTKDFPSKISLERISFSFEDEINPEGTVSEKGIYYLTWESGKENEENIYLSFSKDEKMWSKPVILSTSGKRNIHPTISSYQDEIYVVWQSLDEKMNKWVIKGKHYGKKKWCGKGGWEEIKALSEFEPIYGENPSISLKDGKLFIVWDKEGEIYIRREILR